MSSLFDALVDEAIAEIDRRDAGYLARFPLSISRESNSRVEAVLTQILGARSALGVPDAVGEAVCRSIADAEAAERGELPLKPAGALNRTFDDFLSQDYAECRNKDGTRYLVRRHGGRNLLLINACGVPLSAWSKFLGDSLHDFRIHVVETRGQTFSGGNSEESDLLSDADKIVSVLDDLGAGPFDILAWCDGGRLAIEIAKRRRDRIRALALLSVSFRGAETGEPAELNSFEISLRSIMRNLRQKPELAAFLSKMLNEQPTKTNWDAYAQDPKGRVSALLRLPAEDQALAMRMPMSRDVFLLNHTRRAWNDPDYPAAETLAELDLPILAITGEYDQITNNAATLSVLSGYKGPLIHAEINGAGHYCFDLQYPYLRLLLSEFLAEGRQPTASARVKIGNRRPDSRR